MSGSPLCSVSWSVSLYLHRHAVGKARHPAIPPQQARSSPPSSAPCGRRLRPHWGKLKRHQSRPGGGSREGLTPSTDLRRVASPGRLQAAPLHLHHLRHQQRPRPRAAPIPGPAVALQQLGAAAPQPLSAALRGGSGAQGGGVRQRPRDPRGARRAPRRSPTRRYASFQGGATRPGALYSARCPRSGSSIAARRPPHSARRRAARRDL